MAPFRKRELPVRALNPRQWRSLSGAIGTPLLTVLQDNTGRKSGRPMDATGLDRFFPCRSMGRSDHHTCGTCWWPVALAMLFASPLASNASTTLGPTVARSDGKMVRPVLGEPSRAEGAGAS